MYEMLTAKGKYRQTDIISNRETTEEGPKQIRNKDVSLFIYLFWRKKGEWKNDDERNHKYNDRERWGEAESMVKENNDYLTVFFWLISELTKLDHVFHQ